MKTPMHLIEGLAQNIKDSIAKVRSGEMTGLQAIDLIEHWAKGIVLTCQRSSQNPKDETTNWFSVAAGLSKPR
jgi:hypothetical protein